MHTSVRALILALVLTAIPMTQSRAAELKVLAGGAIADVLKELAPAYERSSGNTLDFHVGATPDLVKHVVSGAKFDLAVAPREILNDAAARTKFAVGPATDVARVGFGVAVRAGAPKPDLGTSDTFKQAMLKAGSIAYLPESAAGAYVTSVFDRLGIGAEMKAKTKRQATPALIVQAITKGDAELGVFLTNVLTAPGLELAGPFPAELQQDFVFVGAVSADTKEAVAARGLIDFLRTPTATTVIRAKGMTPA